MVRTLTVLFLGLIAATGCGSKPALNTTPLTEEQKRQIKEADRHIDDEERSGSGTASPAKKKK